MKGETLSKVAARVAADPTFSSAVAAHNIYGVRGDESYEVADLITELRQQCEEISRGDMSAAERMLVAQAHTLSQLFYSLTSSGLESLRADSAYLYELHMRMALKAQAQCRATLEALSEIKNPRKATFIRQANVANNQQVNNGVEPARAAETENERNELRTIPYEEPVDSCAPRTTSRADPEAEAVGAVHRATNERR